MPTSTTAPLWAAICQRLGVEPSASLDHVHVLLGRAVGRGTLQRIRDGAEGTAKTSLVKIARQLDCEPGDLLNGSAPARRQPPAPDWRGAAELIAKSIPDPKKRELYLDFITYVDRYIADAQRIAESIADMHDR